MTTAAVPRDARRQWLAVELRLAMLRLLPAGRRREALRKRLQRLADAAAAETQSAALVAVQEAWETAGRAQGGDGAPTPLPREGGAEPQESRRFSHFGDAPPQPSRGRHG